ncbi:unnamed protein product [Calicophoron daubneyi]|uniref:Uncharacterized protein n=1 Tax=Calicophoron daubneyi TaxID=300641 RepID=A0AAV2T876_CALDB
MASSRSMMSLKQVLLPCESCILVVLADTSLVSVVFGIHPGAWCLVDADLCFSICIGSTFHVGHTGWCCPGLSRIPASDVYQLAYCGRLTGDDVLLGSEKSRAVESILYIQIDVGAFMFTSDHASHISVLF